MRNLIVFAFLTVSYFSFAQSDSSGSSVATEPPKETFKMVEEMPEFPGGERAMLKYIADHIRYPRKAIRKGIEGTVKLKFVVNVKGDIENIQVISTKKLGYGCEEEAIRVIENMPRWKPGKQNGTLVPVYFSIPINFKLY